MGDMPDAVMRISKALAIFDAKRQLLAEGWDVEQFCYLTWVVDAQPGPADAHGDPTMTFTANYEDTREKSRIAARASESAAVTAHPPPMPTDPDQHWTSVTLRSGGTLTIGVSANPADLRGEDRALVNDVFRRVTAYQKDRASAAQPQVASQL